MILYTLRSLLVRMMSKFYTPGLPLVQCRFFVGGTLVNQLVRLRILGFVDIIYLSHYNLEMKCSACMRLGRRRKLFH